MKIADHVFDHFRAILRRLTPLSYTDQIDGLKSELLSALERADVCERRVHDLEQQIDFANFFDDIVSPSPLAQLEKRVLAAAHARAPEDEPRRRRELEVAQRELVELGMQCQALDAFCRLLLRRMEAPQPSGPAAASDSTPSRALP